MYQTLCGENHISTSTTSTTITTLTNPTSTTSKSTNTSSTKKLRQTTATRHLTKIIMSDVNRVRIETNQSIFLNLIAQTDLNSNCAGNFNDLRNQIRTDVNLIALTFFKFNFKLY